jgi:adenosylmethionine-8-amino-7-oxononanoate aminotransferase
MIVTTETLKIWDRTYSWHPFTQMQEYLENEPLMIIRAQGCWLYDAAGNRYLDGNGSNWSNVHGHNNPDLNQALIEQLQLLQQASYKDQMHPPATELCAELVSIAPKGLTRCFFTDNGSCAIETALKLSFQYWQLADRPEKRFILRMQNSYHGDTFGAMSASHSMTFHGRFSSWFLPAHHFPAPECIEYNKRIIHADAMKSLEALENLLKQHAHQTAILFLEPSIQGPAGMHLQPPGFLKAVAEKCKAHDVHLALDEIFVGLGRTGPILVCTDAGVTPDFLCLSKGLTGGYLPLGATLSTESIYNAFLGTFRENKTFFHGHTFAANPLITAVGVKNIQRLKAHIQTGALERTCDFFGNCVEKYFANHSFIKSVRQRGMVCALELYPGKKNSTSAFDPQERVAHAISLELRKKEVLLRGTGNNLYLIPPLCISNEEIEFLCKQVAQAILDYLN